LNNVQRRNSTAAEAAPFNSSRSVFDSAFSSSFRFQRSGSVFSGIQQSFRSVRR
jgi:hypothetical protein